MRDLRILAFDDVITGTAATWYTSADHNGPLGFADALEIHAVTTNVSGTSPALTCQVEHSANGRHWLNAQASAEIGAVAISNDASFLGVVPLLNPPLLTFVRIRISLSGTSPQCRLKLHVTGRVSRSAGAGQMPSGLAGGMPSGMMPGAGVPGAIPGIPGTGGG